MTLLQALDGVLTDLGRSLVQWRDEGRTGGEWVGPQLKAEADQRAHEYLVQALGALEPGTPVLSEEDERTHAQARPARYWLIDPIDGTASWAGGFSGWVTQAALMADDQPALAVVRAPDLGRSYAASAGGGATLNGARLATLRPAGRRILVDNYPQPRGIAAEAVEALGCTYLESGSIGLKVCLVADGSADLFIKDVPVRDWDMGAPALIAREAGAVLGRLSGEAYVFTGPVEKHGIVVAGSIDDYAAAVAWFARRAARG